MTTKNEVWKEYKEGYYVSNLGRIKHNNRLMKGTKNEKGFAKVLIDGKRVAIHRMVAELFLPKVDGKEFVWHKDRDKTNNSVDNLEWRTKEDVVSRGNRHPYTKSKTNTGYRYVTRSATKYSERYVVTFKGYGFNEKRYFRNLSQAVAYRDYMLEEINKEMERRKNDEL